MSATLDYPARVRLVVTDTSGNDQHGLIWGFRSRHYDGTATAALSYEAETMTALSGAAGTALSGASGGSAVVGTAFPAGVWVPTLLTTLTAGSAPMTHQGSYRTWARCFSASATPEFQLQWGIGALSAPVTNDPVQLPTGGSFYLLDLGVINIQPPPVGTAEWFGVVQAQVANANDQVAIDRLWFQPLDESAGKLASVTSAPASSISSTAGAGSGNDDSSNGGTATWTNPSNVTLGSGPPASVLLSSSQISHYLDAKTFGFAIPSGATITGIQVAVNRNAGHANSIVDSRVRLIKAGTVQSTDRKSSAIWPVTATVATYGGSTDLWGGSWSASDINNSGFGVAIAVQYITSGSNDAFLLGVDITVCYVLSSGFTVAADAVVYGSAVAELRTDGMVRSNAAGTVYGPISVATGDLPRLPPSGLETRPVEVFVKPTRGDLDDTADSGLDGFTAQIKYRPSYLYRP